MITEIESKIENNLFYVQLQHYELTILKTVPKGMPVSTNYSEYWETECHGDMTSDLQGFYFGKNKGEFEFLTDIYIHFNQDRLWRGTQVFWHSPYSITFDFKLKQYDSIRLWRKIAKVETFPLLVV